VPGATALTGLPLLGCAQRGSVAEMGCPSRCAQVVIFGDCDQNYVGQSAAFMLARKISRQKGAPDVEVRIPPTIGHDWNDVLQQSISEDA
jgi:phage/plasmid primase-like uncharacterized protein